jgi:hypothetical protein
LVNFFYSSTGFLVSELTYLREIVDFGFGEDSLDLVAALAAMGLTATFAVSFVLVTLVAAAALAFFFFSASSLTSFAFAAASSYASFSA